MPTPRFDVVARQTAFAEMTAMLEALRAAANEPTQSRRLEQDDINAIRNKFGHYLEEMRPEGWLNRFICSTPPLPK